MIVERPSLERRVTASLDAGRIPVVLGGCGSGRTSLLLRLQTAGGAGRCQYIDVSAAATTPERCLGAILSASRFPAAPPTDGAGAPASAHAAFDRLLAYFDAARTRDDAPATFLLDEFLDLRTFENFPGLRHVQREFVTRLASSPARFVLASRFTTRVHRLLRDASARFEVIHLAPLDADDVEQLALACDGARREWAADVAGPVSALTAGRAGAVTLLLAGMASQGLATDPLAAFAALFAPDGQLRARCRESYEFRLQRARGYGALKAILGVLAETEPLNLTEIALRLRRTPGSTKDYLSWLEDVDLVAAQGKRYSFEDPLLRLYVRLYGRPGPPTDDDIVREVAAYARARLPLLRPAPAPIRPVEVAVDSGRSGIIEID